MRARASGRAAPSSSGLATIREVSHLVITPYAPSSSGLATIREVSYLVITPYALLSSGLATIPSYHLLRSLIVGLGDYTGGGLGF